MASPKVLPHPFYSPYRSDIRRVSLWPLHLPSTPTLYQHWGRSLFDSKMVGSQRRALICTKLGIPRIFIESTKHSSLCYPKLATLLTYNSIPSTTMKRSPIALGASIPPLWAPRLTSDAGYSSLFQGVYLPQDCYCG